MFPLANMPRMMVDDKTWQQKHLIMIMNSKRRTNLYHFITISRQGHHAVAVSLRHSNGFAAAALARGDNEETPGSAQVIQYFSVSRRGILVTGLQSITNNYAGNCARRTSPVR